MMNKTTDKPTDVDILHDRRNYQVDNLDSEIRAEQYCAQLLKLFHQYLLQEQGIEPLDAGSRAAGADYFLREFTIGRCRDNIFAATAERIRQFAGNWYIISTLEPNMCELESILQGVASFYGYCAIHQLVERETAEQIAQSCELHDYYRQRIEDFHNISGNGYNQWNQACPL